ncbi:hypothetical protein [Blastopirellula marina]|uniref:Uncharacterized protein n=1 Tax=Blastopirellula marina TaxID=124 RepID=A0A2S8FNA8_9BACT|nr:hypothetical protein [Blastopirellula marina]PQO33627.1 hypothetical protein C5Y98_15410 [Blastopirellula marina]PTL43414.1 hypothetical protein C5Y97_15420 [Blastopirellula marina]
METDISIAQSYLLPPARPFWRWADDGEVISLKSGATVAFREELAQILNRLSPNGLPPLSCVLLVLASLRDRCYVPVGDVLATIGWQRPTDKMNSLVESLFVDPNGLAKLRKLNPELKNNTAAKVNLCQIIFENVAPVVNAQQAKTIVLYLKGGIHEVLSNYRDNTSSNCRITLDDLKQLRSGLDAVDQDSLDLREQTSLDSLPQPAEVELPLGQRACTILDELQNDEELQGLARLARQLMAAVTLPRRLADPEEIPMGGVSDISNRGPLDRLLLTELVHDDLTLAVRVSSNEALYLRRESPPRDAWREFSLLLDSGIRMWGVPRVFATAVSLALMANADQHTHLTTFRARGQQLDTVDLLSREGLVRHLEALEPSVHPGEALAAFSQAIDAGENTSPILVTTQDVLEDESFQQALAKTSFPAMYLAVVQRDGEFRLIEKNERGRKAICSVQLDLDRVLARPRHKSPPLFDSELRKDLPAIFSVQPFPLLVSVNLPQNQLIDLEAQGVLGITKDGFLCHWHSEEFLGAQAWPVDAPAGKLVWYSYQPAEKVAYAVVHAHRSRERHLLKLHLDSRSCDTALLKAPDTQWMPLAIHGGVLLAYMNSGFVAFDLRTGEVRHQLAAPVSQPACHGRFCWVGKEYAWYAIAFNGSTICLERIQPAHVDIKQPFIHVFEYDGGDGPLAITPSGSIHCTMSGETWEFLPTETWKDKPPRVMSHANRVWFESTGVEAYIVDVRKRTYQTVRRFQHGPALHPSTASFVTPINTRHRFTHISVERIGSDFRIVLTGRKGTRHALEMRPTRVHKLRRMTLELAKPATDIEKQTTRTFKPVNAPHLGCHLSRAEWDDGSQAFLDSRGMLHLKPADKRVPEVSIVLKDGALAGWLSDGRLWGYDYFTGKTIDLAVEREAFDIAVLGFIKGIV